MSSKRGLSRRRFLVLSASTAIGTGLLAACQPQVVEKEKIVEKPVEVVKKETVVVEKEKIVEKPVEKIVEKEKIVVATAVPKTAEKVKLRFWSHNFKPMMDVIDKTISRYRVAKPNVEVEYVATGVQDHINKLHVTLAAGTSPDGFNNGDWNFALLQSKKWIAPVIPESFGVATQKEVYNLFFEFMMKPSADRRGDVYGVPMNWAALSVYYNVKSFEEAGLDPKKPPLDWLTLTEYATKLTKRDAQGNILKPGWQQNYGPGTEWPFKRLYPMINQLGGGVLNDDATECLLTTPEALEAIQLSTDWTAKHKVSLKGYAPAGVTGIELFAQGYTPMIVGGAFNYQIDKQQKPDFQLDKDDMVSRFPQWPAGKNKKELSPLWGWNWFVGSPSKLKEEMWAYINFLAQHDEELQQDAGHLKIRKAGSDSPFPKGYPKELLATISKDHETGGVVPQTPKFEEMAKQVVEMMERIETGIQPVKTAAEEAKRKIDAILVSSPPHPLSQWERE